MLKKIFSVICVLVLSVFVSTTVFASEVSAPKFTPKIDGKVDAGWKDATAFKLEVSSTGDAKFAGTVKAAWDDNNFYLLYDVTDPTWSDKGSNEGKDSAELWLDFPNGHSGSYDVSKGSGHIRVSIDKDISTNTPGAESWLANSAVAKKDGGYVIELAVKWQGGVKPAVDTVVGFTPSINDDRDLDGTRDTYITTTTGAYWSSLTVLDAVKLAAAPAASAPAANPATGDDFSVVIYSLAALVLAAAMFYLIKRPGFSRK